MFLNLGTKRFLERLDSFKTRVSQNSIEVAVATATNKLFHLGPGNFTIWPSSYTKLA